MIRHKIFFLLVSFVLLSVNSSYGASLASNYEAGLALSSGTFTHTGEAFGGSSFSILNPDISFNYYLNPTQAIISGLAIDINLGTSEVGLIGLRGGYKWYYWGQGYYERSESPMMTIKTQQRFSSYVGGVLKRYAYFLSSSFETEGSFESSGSFFTIDALVGADYMLSHQIKATSSLSLSIVSLAATDNRIKMVDKLFIFGICYLF